MVHTHSWYTYNDELKKNYYIFPKNLTPRVCTYYKPHKNIVKKNVFVAIMMRLLCIHFISADIKIW